jgi:hypothetical protein
MELEIFNLHDVMRDAAEKVSVTLVELEESDLKMERDVCSDRNMVQYLIESVLGKFSGLEKDPLFFLFQTFLDKVVLLIRKGPSGLADHDFALEKKIASQLQFDLQVHENEEKTEVQFIFLRRFEST